MSPLDEQGSAHVDDDVLALLALGEPVDEAARAHVAGCAECAAEVASLGRVVEVGRAASLATDAPVAPPPSVWAGIQAELGLADGGRAATAPTSSAPSTVPEASDEAPPVGVVTPLRPRRNRAWIAAAAAAGVVVGGTVGGVGASWLSDRGADDGRLVAEATLDPLPGRDAVGQAVVTELEDGSRVLQLTVDDGGVDQGYREVWLIDREVTRLVSLGVLAGSQGSFTVPDGLDLTDFAVVDVSDEPFDGDPAHSGDSVVRGILDA